MRLLIDGGLFFTGPIALIGGAILGLSIYTYNKLQQQQNKTALIKWIAGLGLFALIFGILGQLIGLMEGLNRIAAAGSVSSDVLIAGIKISSISTLLGAVVFILSKLTSFYLTRLQKKLKIG